MGFHSIKQQSSWQDFWSVYCALTRQAELERLLHWAKQKRLAGPCKGYQSRLEDEYRRIFTYRVRSPRLTALARLLQHFNKLLFPTPLYFPSGSAKMYRSRRLTRPEKAPIIMYRQSA